MLLYPREVASVVRCEQRQSRGGRNDEARACNAANSAILMSYCPPSLSLGVIFDTSPRFYDAKVDEIAHILSKALTEALAGCGKSRSSALPPQFGALHTFVSH